MNRIIFATENQGKMREIRDILGRSGREVISIGELGNDMHGQFLRDTLIKEHIDAGNLMVQEGKADVCITAIKPAELYIEANPDCGLCISPYIDFEVDEELQGSRICMEKGETELLNAVNDIIDGVLESGIYEEWYEEYSELAASLGV